MGDTLDRLKADRGIARAFVLAIEGFDQLITSHDDTSAAVTAWSGTDWSQAISGLHVEGTYSQEIEPLSRKLGVGGLSFRITPDDSDSLGIEVFDRGSGDETRLTADADNDDTTITVNDTSSFASSGDIYIGTERISYTGTTATTFTGCTRGTFSPFGVDGGTRFGRHHKRPSVDAGVDGDPAVTSAPRTWRGKWVGLWLHRINPGGVWDTKGEAQLIFAGLIDTVADTQLGETVIDCRDVRSKIAETTLLHEQFVGKLQEGVFLHAGTPFKCEETGTADDLDVVASGASGANEIDEGYYTIYEIADFLSEWLASEVDAGNITGPFGIDPEHQTSDGLRFRIISDASFSIKAPPQVWRLAGFNSPGEWQGTFPGLVEVVSDDVPFRVLAESLPIGPLGTLQVAEPEGTWINQRDWLPGRFDAIADSISGSGLGDWGFLVIGDSKIAFALHTSDTTFDNVRVGDDLDAIGGQTHTNADLDLQRRIDEEGDITIKQLVLLMGTFEDLVTALFASTGTEDYNSSTHDKLGFGLGAAIPWELLGTNWEDSIGSLAEADGTMMVRLEKPLNLWGVLHSSFQLRSAHIVWRNQGLRVASWSTPVSDLAEHTLTESNKALPIDLDDRGRDRSITTESTRAQVTRILIEHDHDLDGDSQARTSIIDAAAETDHGIQRGVTIRARNDYGSDAVGFGDNTIDPLVSDLGARTLPMISRPITVMKRTIDQRLFEDVAPGDLGAVTDDHARDPSDGTRGLSGKPGILLSHSWSWEDGAGEVEIGFYPRDRVAPWSPTAQFTGDNYSADTPQAGESTITCTEHQFSTATESVDASHFEAGDEVTILEVDPSDPASATSWTVTIVSRSGNDLVLDDNLAGIGTTSSDHYNVISRSYSVATSTQRTDTYQADDADLQVEDLRQPYELGALAGTNAFDARDLADLPERHATDYWGDGVPLAVGAGDQLARMSVSLLNYKTALSAPMLSDTAIQTGGAAVAFRLAMVRPIFFGKATYGPLTRMLEVAPFFRGDGSNTRDLRVTLSRSRPSGSSTASVTFTGPKSQATFSRLSTTWTTASASELEIPHTVNARGYAWITIETEDGIQTRGLGICRVKEIST